MPGIECHHTTVTTMAPKEFIDDDRAFCEI
jgi:hypothetical protein